VEISEEWKPLLLSFRYQFVLLKNASTSPWVIMFILISPRPTENIFFRFIFHVFSPLRFASRSFLFWLCSQRREAREETSIGHFAGYQIKSDAVNIWEQQEEEKHGPSEKLLTAQK
jgi:hypothetical protein